MSTRGPKAPWAIEEKRARARLDAPKCLDCPEITLPPHKRCNACELANFYRERDAKR